MDVDSIGSLFMSSPMMNDMTVNRAKNAADVSQFEQLLKRTMAPEITAQDYEPEIKPAPASDSQTSASRFAKIDKSSKLYEQCIELEIFMVKTLITGMRNTIQKSGLIEEGFAGKMYEDMLYDEYARDFAINSKFGMAEMAYLELTGQRGKQLPVSS